MYVNVILINILADLIYICQIDKFVLICKRIVYCKSFLKLSQLLLKTLPYQLDCSEDLL